MLISAKSPNKQLNKEKNSTDVASLDPQKASTINELRTPQKTFINSIENNNKKNEEEDVSHIEPVAKCSIPCNAVAIAVTNLEDGKGRVFVGSDEGLVECVDIIMKSTEPLSPFFMNNSSILPQMYYIQIL